jgi:PAS domain S-box-containing protein
MTDEVNNEPVQSILARHEQIEKELNLRLRQQAALAELGQRALSSTDLENLFDNTVHLVAQTLAVEYCEVLELLSPGAELLLRAGLGWREGHTGHTKVGAGNKSQAGYTLLSKAPVIVTDLDQETRFSPPQFLLDHCVRSGMTVIIPGKNQPLGILGMHSTQPRSFSQEDAKFLQAVANLLASSIARLDLEATIRSSRDQLEIILQGVADAITVQDRSGRLAYANDAAARIIGYPSAEQLLNIPFDETLSKLEISDEAGNPLALDQLPGRMALRGHGSNSAALRWKVPATGEERWVLVKATPVLNHYGQVDLAVTIFQDVTEQKRAERTQRLLAEVGKLVAAPLDYSKTLSEVADMMVPELADWCSIYIVEDDQSIHQVAVAHANPNKDEQDLRHPQRFPLDLQLESWASRVLRSGQAEFYPEITPELRQEIAQDEEHLKFLHGLGMKSAMILPLTARDETLGAIAFVWAESGKRYTQADVTLAEELVRRAAIAIYTARLYHRTQRLNEELEARVARRTNQLQQMIQTLREEITERKKAEQALRQSESMLQGLFDSAPDAMILVNEEGQIVRVNRQTAAMFGYSAEELVGKSVDILLPSIHQTQHADHRADYFTKPYPRPMGAGLELRGKRKDGSQFPVDVMLSPVETKEGVMVISAVRDVSEREEMQAEIAEMQHQFIDGLESERVLLAQELHDGPIQDLYGVIYELKAIDIQKDGDRGPGLEGSVASAAAGAQHVIEVIRAICGELRPPTLAPFGLEKAIQEHISHIQKTNPDLDVHLDLMADGQELPEKVRFAFFRVYQNAVNNVVRHAHASNLYIRFRFDAESATLEIEDDGTGFRLPSRWVEFSRQGHLGLVGMVERVKTINGQLNIVSSPGKGTTIRATIPRS